MKRADVSNIVAVEHRVKSPSSEVATFSISTMKQ